MLQTELAQQEPLRLLGNWFALHGLAVDRTTTKLKCRQDLLFAPAWPVCIHDIFDQP